MERITSLGLAEKEAALAQLMILAGLRDLTDVVERETYNMPIDLDIRDHKTLGPLFRAAEERGLEKGMQKGELTILHRQLERRYGPLPAWATNKLAAMSASDLEELSVRVLDARSLNDLFGSQA